jgi:uncharacterized protein with ATP-grasp and redox domains
MEIAIECGACAAIQMTRTLAVRSGEWRKVMPELLGRIGAGLTAAENPGQMLTTMYDSVQELTGDGDPYRAGKDLANQRAEAWWRDHALPLDDLPGRFHLAAAGNAIDAGVDADADITWGHFLRAVERPLALDHREPAERWLEARNGARIVYLLDNCGEAVLDREVMRTLTRRGLDVTAVVKGRPIINDITRREADRIGLDEVARVIDNGSDAVGIQPGRTREQVIRLLEDADLVIAKGLSHLETLSHWPRRGPVLFLYQAKCPPSARLVGVPEQALVAWWRLPEDPPRG